MIHPEVAQHIPEIQTLCREFGVAKLEIFGSAVTNEFDPDRSDVDFLVTYPKDYDFGLWAGRLQDFERRLSEVIGRDADLVMLTALRNKWFRREADKTRLEIFDASQISQIA